MYDQQLGMCKHCNCYCSDVQMASHEKGNEQAHSRNSGRNEGYDEQRSYRSDYEGHYEVEPFAE